MTDPNVKPNEESNATSFGLLARVRLRDQEAWERLVSLYAPLVDHWIKQAGMQAADVADLRQEVFLAVSRKIAAFRRDRPEDTFRGWLRTIVQNKIRDFHRRKRTNLAQPVDEAEQQQMLRVPAPELADSSEASDHDEICILYRRAIELVAQDFQERSWQAFWRVVIDGQQPRDVANDLQMTVNAVYLAKGRVLARLRERFTGLMEI